MKIEIPLGLSPSEEAAVLITKLIGKQLENKTKMIGSGNEIKSLETTITIVRVPKITIKMLHCNMCDCDYDSKLAWEVEHNYGGRKRRVKLCSKECAEILTNHIGDRARLIKKRMAKCHK